MINLIYINTQEWLRLKFLQVVFFLAFAYVCLSYLLATLSFTDQLRIKFNLGFTGLELATVLVAAFISTHALDRDIERKTFQVILARPIARWHLLIGYLGSIFFLNAILVFFMTLVMVIFFGLQVDLLNVIVVSYSLLLKSVVVGAFGLMLSTLARPMFGLVMVFSYWAMAYSVPDIRYFIQKIQSSSLERASIVFDYIFPQFYLFNWKSYRDVEAGFIVNDVVWASLHCFGWVFLLMFLASVFIRKKDIV